MAHIRYKGSLDHKIPNNENEVFKRLLTIINSDEMFTSLNYENLEEEFKINWKTYVKKSLEHHIDFVNFWTDDIMPSNMVVIYPTNIANGRIFIKSIIVPTVILNEAKNKNQLPYSQKLNFKINLEVGVYNNDGSKSYMLENLYLAST